MESTWIICNKQLTKKKKREQRFITVVKPSEENSRRYSWLRPRFPISRSFFLPVRGPTLPGRRGNLSRCESNVTAWCRVTVYSESQISRRYLIDPSTRMRKVRAAPESQSKFRISKIFSRDPLAGNVAVSVREDAQSLARVSFRNSIQASGALLWDSRGIDSRATGKIYTGKRVVNYEIRS